MGWAKGSVGVFGDEKKKKGKQDNEPQKEIKQSGWGYGGGWIRYYSAET